MAKKFIKYISVITALSLLIGGGYWYYQRQRLYPSTDDAYIKAHTVEIAPQISGHVAAVFVQNHQFVTKGQPLFSIVAKPFKLSEEKAQAELTLTQDTIKSEISAVATAKAVLAQRQAQLFNSEKNYQRIMSLARRNLISPSKADQATSKLRVAKAARNAAQSELRSATQKLGQVGLHNAQLLIAQTTLAQARLNLSYTKIYAPANGYLVNFKLQPGDEVAATNPVFALIENYHWWAQANFKETDIKRIKPGQSATIIVDMYPRHKFKGKVISISRGSGASFSLLPPENASGNWVKVTQRFPVRVEIEAPNSHYPLRLGASCTVTINTTTS